MGMTAVAERATAGFGQRPLAPTFGLEVTGLDLHAPIPPATAAALRAAFDRHRLLILRGLDISPEEQSRFGRVFGEIVHREQGRVQPADEHSLFVSNVRPDGLFGDVELAFHLDHLFYEAPLDALMLYGVEVTSRGGETCFCDTDAVYEALPTALKRRVALLTCRSVRAYTPEIAARYNVASNVGNDIQAVHPLLYQDPDTGHRAIWVNRRWSVEVPGLPEAEGQALLAELRHYIETSTATYAHAWRPGDLVLWNNRTLLHARNAFPTEERRSLRRTPILRA